MYSNLFLVQKLNFHSRLQCHMILQKSFEYADLVLKQHLFIFLLSVLRTVVLLNILVVVVIQFSLMNRKFKSLLSHSINVREPC